MTRPRQTSAAAISAIGLFVSLLAACGQMGPLSLPETAMPSGGEVSASEEEEEPESGARDER